MFVLLLVYVCIFASANSDSTGFIAINHRKILSEAPTGNYDDYVRTRSYMYEDGETVLVECGVTPPGFVKMIYENKGAIASSGIIKDRTAFSLKLTDDDQQSFLKCSILEMFEVRLNFYMKKSSDSIRLKINNMLVRPYKGAVYQHFYNNGEITNVSCDSKRDGYNVILRHSGSYIDRPNIKYTVKLEEYHDNLTCQSKNEINSEEKDIITVQFQQKFDDFYITGLNYDQIVQQYQNTSVSSSIKYEYSDGDQLRLNCTSVLSHMYDYGTILRFFVNGGAILKKAISDNNQLIVKINVDLDSNYNNSVIKCSRRYKVVESNINIILLYKKKLDIISNDNNNNDNEEDRSSKNENEEDHIIGNNNEKDRGSGNESLGKGSKPKEYLYWHIGLGVLAVLIVMLCAVAYGMGNHWNKKQSSEPTYANLINSCDSSPSPAVQDVEPQYQNTMPIGPTNLYTEIQRKADTSDAPVTPQYAQIIKKNVNVSDYQNSGQSARYVNGNVFIKEFVEPAYCELIHK